MKNKGMIMFIALITLPLIAVLSTTLLGNSFYDMKLVNARSSHYQSNIELYSASRDILAAPNSDIKLANATNSTTFTSTLYSDVETATQINGELDCKRSKKANDNKIKCRYVEVSFAHRFGKARKSDGKKWGLNQLNVGIEQLVFSE